MARKTLSSQVIDEVDRCRGLLAPVQDITDPMTSHLVGTALASLQRIENICLNAMQAAMNEVTADSPLSIAFTDDALDRARKRASGAAKPATTRKPRHTK